MVLQSRPRINGLHVNIFGMGVEYCEHFMRNHDQSRTVLFDSHLATPIRMPLDLLFYAG